MGKKQDNAEQQREALGHEQVEVEQQREAIEKQ